MPISPDLPDIATLEALDLEGLRACWRTLIGPPPKLRSTDLLRQILAWQVQTQQQGGLDKDTRRRLGQKSSVTPTRLHNGTRIIKIWQGQRYEVLVDHDGPLFEGRRYRSLSEIARTITGTRWNGPRFFGLRDTKVAA